MNRKIAGVQRKKVTVTSLYQLVAWGGWYMIQKSKSEDVKLGIVVASMVNLVMYFMFKIPMITYNEALKIFLERSTL